MIKSKVAIVRCKSYESDLVERQVREVVDLLGGITTFVKPKSKVLVKPNILMAKSADSAVDTHPEVVRAAIRILKDIDARIFVGDSPSAFAAYAENIEEVYLRSGIKKVCQEENVQMVEFDKKRWHNKIPLAAFLDECDCLVSVPKFKTHDLMTLTGGVKNLFGLIPGTYKVELHKQFTRAEDFAKVLVDIYQEVRSALTIVDAVVAMEGDGPGTSGRLRNLGLLFAGSDAIAIDSLLALIMGLNPEDIATTKEGAKRGLGNSDLENIELVGEKLEDLVGRPFLLPQTSLAHSLPPFLTDIAKKFIRFYPYIEDQNCTRCQNCVKICPQEVMNLKNGRIQIDYRGCISCFCCQEACPAAAIKIKKSILAKVIGL